MVRRFLSLLCVFCIVLTLFCIPVFAADSFYYRLPWTIEDGFILFTDSLPAPGTYSYSISFSSPDYSFSVSGVGVLVFLYSIDGVSVFGLPFIFDSYSVNFVVLDSGSHSDLRDLVFIEFADGGIPSCFETGVFDVTLVPYHNPDFVDATGNGLLAGLSWIGSVVNALINGVLSPLMGLIAVAVVITFILVACKIIRYLSWGS